MADESLYRVDGTDGDDNPLNGTSLSDEIYGLAGADTIDGGAGNDTIRGGDGDDIIRGGSGYNTVVYWGYEQDFQSTWIPDSATGALTIEAITGTATESLGTDTLYNIQAVGFYEWDSFSGQYYYYERQIDDQSDRVDLAGDDLTSLAYGGGKGGVINYAGDVDVFKVSTEVANQTVYLGTNSTGQTVQIVDTDGTSVLATDVSQYSFASAGDYYVNVSGSTGGYSFLPQNIYTDVGPGDDTVDFGSGPGYQRVSTGDGDDSVTDSSGDDRIELGAGDDTVTLSTGNDYVHGGGGYDEVILTGSRSDYTLQGYEQSFVLTGNGLSASLDAIEKLTFDDVSLEVDPFPESKSEADLLMPVGTGYGLGDQVRGYVVGNDHRNEDWIPFDIDPGQIQADSQFLLVFDTDRSNAFSYYFSITDGSRSIYFSGNDTVYEKLAGNTSYSNPSNGNIIQFGRYGTHTEIKLGNLVWDGNAASFFDGGRIYLRLDQLREFGTESGYSVALYQYTELTDSADVIDGLTAETRLSHRADGVYVRALGGDDYVVGTSYAEILDGGAGADTLIGNGGDDQFIVDSNSTGDTIDGGQGNDALKLSSSFDLGGLNFTGIESVTGSSSSVQATMTGTQFNSLSSFDGVSVMLDAGADVTIGDKSFTNGAVLKGYDVTVTAGNGSDNQVTFTGGSNTYTGGAGNETLVSSTGDDSITMGDGNDRVTDTGGSDSIDMGAGNDTLTITADTKSDAISLGDGDDRVVFSNAVLASHLGAIDGGEGTDTLVLTAGSSDLSGYDLTGFERVLYNSTDGSLATVTLSSEQFNQIGRYDGVRVMLSDGGAADTTGVVFGLGSYLVLSGGETLTDTGDVGKTVTLSVGGADLSLGSGDDNVTGSAGADVIATGGGDDSVTTGGGADQINTGAGSDTVVVVSSETNGSIQTGDGDDLVRFSGSVSVGATGSIDGGDGTDTVKLQAAGDYSGFDFTSVEAFQLSGAGTYIFDQTFLNSFTNLAEVGLGDTANVTVKARALVSPDQAITTNPTDAVASLELSAPGGLDASGITGWSGQVTGSSGDDTLTVGSGLSAVSGRGGDDVITGSSGIDLIYGDGGDDTIVGGAGNDQIFGGAGDDTIRGGDGADTITGGLGDDVIEGGAGADVIRGGSGYNTVVYYANQDDFLVIGQPDASGLLTITPAPDGGAAGLGIDKLYDIQEIGFYEYNNTTGGYDYWDVQIDDYSNYLATDAASFGYGELVSGLIDYAGDKDYRRLDVADPNTQIRLESSVSGGRLQLLDTTGNVVYEYGNSGSQSVSNVAINLTDPGTYYLRMAGNTTELTGGYSATLRQEYSGTGDGDDTVDLGTDYQWVDTGAGDDTVRTSGKDDYVQLGDGDDTAYLSAGDDVIHGGRGFNTLVIEGARSGYSIAQTGNYQFKLTDVATGDETVVNDFHRLRFADETVELKALSRFNDASDVPPVYEYGDVVRAYQLDTGPNQSTRDYFSVDFDPRYVTETSQFLMVIDSQGYNYNYVYLKNDSGDYLYFDNLTKITGNAYTYDNRFYFHSGHTEISFDGGLWGNNAAAAFSGGVIDFEIDAYSGTNNLNQYSVSVYQYKPLTEQADDEVLNHRFDGLYVRGLGGDDEITGTDYAEILDGGAGADTLIGNGGDDQFIVDSNSTGDTIDGGQGNDALKLSSSFDLGGLNFTGIESVTGSSSSVQATMTGTQFNSLSSFDGVSVMLDAGADVTIGDKSFTNGAVLKGYDVTVTAGNGSDNQVTFTGGSNTYTGGAGNETLVSSTGDDSISMGDGNDRVTDTGGSDSIDMGAGNDTLTITADTKSDAISLGDGDDRVVFSNAVLASHLGAIDGGEGTDTLVLTAGSSDLSGYDLTGFEFLEITGYGVYTLAEGSLSQFTIDLSAAAAGSFVLEKTSVPFTSATGDFSGSGEPVGVSASEDNDTLVGSGYDDLLVGNGGADTISGGAGRDTIFGGDGDDFIQGGDGADSIHPGAGTDIVDAGAGGDTIYLGPETTERVDGGGSVSFGDYSASNRTYLVTPDLIEGGDGSDTLAIELKQEAGRDVTFNFFENVSGIENISITSTNTSESYAYYNYFYYAGQIFEDLQAQSWTGKTQIYNRYIVYGEDTDVDFRKIDAGWRPIFEVYGDAGTVYLGENFGPYEGNFYLYGDAEELYLSAGPWDNIQLNDNDLTIHGSSQDDSVRISNSSAVIDVLNVDFDAGDGNDTLILQGNIVDITGSSFTNLETISATGSAIIGTQDQFDTLNIVGNAAHFVKDETFGFLKGTDDADSFTGSGVEAVHGGGGNDTISNVHSVYFTGTYSEYQVQGDGVFDSDFSITHIGGTPVDGTDRLINVMSLWFPSINGTYEEHVIDDFPNRIGSNQDWFELAKAYGGRLDYVNRSNTGENKVDSGSVNYSGDSDLFYAELVPSSPLDLEIGTGGGWSAQFHDGETGDTIYFWSPVMNSYESRFYSWMSNQEQLKWTPMQRDDYGVFQKYEGGEVVIAANINELGTYTIGLELLDDFSASTATVGMLDPERGYITGYIGDQDGTGAVVDRDWVGINMVAGTTYEIDVIGLGGKGGTLADPYLRILNESGNDVLHEEDGYLLGDQVGNDVYTEFTAGYSGLYYLEVSSGAEWNTVVDFDEVGSWTMQVKSQDQYSADVNTTGLIQLDALSRGQAESEINEAGDRDWFKVYLEKGVTYKIEAVGNATSNALSLDDPEVEIISPSGIRIKGDDDSGFRDIDAELSFAPTMSGYYFVGAAGSGNASKGTYQVRVSVQPDDFADDMTTTGQIRVGETIDGLLETTNDSDWFATPLAAGEYVIRVRADNDGALDPVRDTFMVIRDVNGNPVAWSDDSKNSLDSEIYLDIDENTAGTYFIEVRGGFKFDVGAYEVSISQTPTDEYADNVPLETGEVYGALGIGQMVSAGIQKPGDMDVFEVSLSANVVYQFDAYGFAGIANMPGVTPSDDLLSDPYMRLFDAEGRLLFSADDGGLGADAREWFISDTAQTVYLQVSSTSATEIGQYRVGVQALDRPGDDVGDTPAQATYYEIGRDPDFEGEILIRGDKDVFRVELEGGKDYVFRVNGLGTGEGTIEDPRLELRTGDNGSILVASDSDSGWYENSLIYYKPEADGVYYLTVTSDTPAEGEELSTGTYRLVIREPDDHGDTSVSATEVTVNGAAEAGAINYNDGVFGASALGSVARSTDADIDWFKFSLDGVTSSEQQTAIEQALVQANEDLANVSRINTQLGVAVAASPDSDFVSLAAAFGYDLVEAAASAIGRLDRSVIAATLDAAESAQATVVSGATDDRAAQESTLIQITEANAALLSAIDTGADYGSLLDTAVGLIVGVDNSVLLAATSAAKTAQESHVASLETQLNASGNVYTVTVDASSVDGTSRPMFEVIDRFGNIVGHGDGKESGNVAGTAFVATGTGPYYIAVTDGAGGTGDYSVSVTSGDVSDEDFSVTPIPMGPFDSSTQSVTKTGNIGVAGDEDTYSFAVTEGHTYRVTIDGARDGSTAPLESLSVSPSWAELSISSDIGGGYTLSYEADSDQTLTLTVGAEDGISTGRYFVELVDLGTLGGDDYANTVDDYSSFTVPEFSVGESFSGEISYSGDVDLVAVALTAGVRYEFTSLGFQDMMGSLATPTLNLLNSNGQMVASGDVDLDTGRATLNTSVISSGTYYLEAGAMGYDGNLGTYQVQSGRLEALVGSDLIADNASTGYSVAPGRVLDTEIEFSGDVDWVYADLEAGKTYRLDQLGAGAGYGTLTDGTLRVIDPDGLEVAGDTDSGAGLDAKLVFTAERTGRYFFEAKADYDQVGTYVLRLRELYSGVEDPLAPQQFYLDALGIYDVSDRYTGAGITVGVIDDGIEYAHPDLMNQIDFAGDTDEQFGSDDGRHKYPDFIPYPPDAHGTPVAGIIAAEASNETGVRGIAPDALIAATRVKWATGHMIGALAEQVNFDISNNSWGAVDIFADDFNRADWMLGYQNMRYAVENGRDGNGTVFVFSAGNSRAAGDNVNYHNFQNARETITVAATEADGSVASFSTPGAAVLVGAYGVGLMTTDRLGGLGYNKAGDYTSFTGTSAAAPAVSGVVALMLEANPDLGYRDVQKILAYTAWHPDYEEVWSVNGSSKVNLTGMLYNDDLGFGHVDGRAAVRLAETWHLNSTSANEVRAGDRNLEINEFIPDDGTDATYSFTIDTHINVEHAVLSVDIAHPRLGDLQLELTSPDGTVSTLIDRPTVTEERPFGLCGEFSDTPGRIIFDLSSVQFMDEDAFGTWTVSIRDVRAEEVGLVRGMSLNVYGSAPTDDDVYVITDEFSSLGVVTEIRDDGGYDRINGSALSETFFIDLEAREGMVGGVFTDGLWDGGQEFTIADWSVIEAAYGGDNDDQLIGNEADNYLWGGAGNDLFFGGLGSDTFEGGTGDDCVIYEGEFAAYQSLISFDSETRCVSVSGGAGDSAWSDSLYQVERIAFDDVQIYLDDLFTLNTAPTINTEVLDEPIVIGNGQSLSMEIPVDAFSDAEEGSGELELRLLMTDDDGNQVGLPSWLSFDPETRRLEGEPEASDVGRYRLSLSATDDFGEEVSREIILQVGDNRAPDIESPRTIEIDEDGDGVLLSITRPTDADGDSLVVQITEIPAHGTVYLGSGDELTVGAEITPDQLADLSYAAAENFVGDAGTLRYTALDSEGMASTGSLSIQVNPVNDAPVFGLVDGNYNIVYDGEQVVTQIDVPVPSDVEESITTVTVLELPVYGSVTIDGTPLVIGQDVPVADLPRMLHTIDQSVKGPIGDIVLEATDSLGLSTSWSASLFVNGEAGLMVGSSSGDTLYGSLGDDLIYGFGGDDIIAANQGADRIYAGTGADIVLGGDGDDQIDGGAGDDYLEGGAGRDILRGGPGDDIYVVDPGDIVVETLTRGAGGFDTVRTATTWSAETGIEALEASGSDNIDLTGNELNNVLLGNGGNNVLSGGEGVDILVGGDGDDTLDGGAGRDRMVGGLGDDLFYVDAGTDQVVEEADAGADRVYASVDYVLTANVEDLVLVEGAGDIAGAGNALDNTITGNSGDNLINGGGGDDTMIGGDGDDTYVVNSLHDVVIDTSGIDTVRSSIDYTLADGIENGRLLGFRDLSLDGNDAENELTGNLGDNMIDGLGGADVLTGGHGGDGFVASVNDGTYDTITDFTSGLDLMLVDAVAFDLFDMETLTGFTKGGLDESDLAFIRADGGYEGNVDAQFIYDTRSQILSVDADGSGGDAAVALFELAGSGVSINYDDVYVLI